MKNLLSILALLSVIGMNFQAKAEYKECKFGFFCTYISEAIEDGNVGFVKRYLAAKNDVNDRDGSVNALLHRAVFGNSLEVARFLVDVGADVNTRDGRDWTPLHKAAYHNSLKIAEFLISKGADVNVRNNIGSTPLHLAVSWSNLKMVQLLVNAGANVNAWDNTDSTPLHKAIIRESIDGGKSDIINFLRSKGAKE